MTASKALAVSDSAVSPDELTEAIRVAVPERGLQQDLRAIGIVWRRELIRFRSDRVRAITSLIQPVLFLFVLGTGLSGLASRGMPTGVDFKTFIYPGVVAMSVLFTAIFSAASIVWDREFGFLREMLVAPVSRSALVIGKALGGATVASFQGIVMLALAGFAGVPYWLTVLTRVDPLTYSVAPMRDAVFSHLSISPAALHTLAPGVTWGGWSVPVGLSLGIVAVMGLAM